MHSSKEFSLHLLHHMEWIRCIEVMRMMGPISSPPLIMIILVLEKSWISVKSLTILLLLVLGKTLELLDKPWLLVSLVVEKTVTGGLYLIWLFFGKVEQIKSTRANKSVSYLNSISKQRLRLILLVEPF